MLLFISVVKKQRIEEFDYTNTTISDGEIKKESSNAAHIKWKYRFEGYKLKTTKYDKNILLHLAKY